MFVRYHSEITKITLNLPNISKVLTTKCSFNFSKMTMVTMIMANPLNTKQTINIARLNEH